MASRAAARSHGQTDVEPRDEARRAIDDAHEMQDAALTKLRLITGRAMGNAAFNLHAVGAATDHDHAEERACSLIEWPR